MKCSESKIDNENLFSNTIDNFFDIEYQVVICWRLHVNSHLQAKKE